MPAMRRRAQQRWLEQRCRLGRQCWSDTHSTRRCRSHAVVRSRTTTCRTPHQRTALASCGTTGSTRLLSRIERLHHNRGLRTRRQGTLSAVRSVCTRLSSRRSSLARSARRCCTCGWRTDWQSSRLAACRLGTGRDDGTPGSTDRLAPPPLDRRRILLARSRRDDSRGSCQNSLSFCGS